MHVFIAGLMQGSREDHLIDTQDYRRRISEALQAHIPGVKISDPFGLHPDSINYGAEKVHETFLTLTGLAGKADLVIAYLPEASMGTAIEMWTAYNANKAIVAVANKLAASAARSAGISARKIHEVVFVGNTTMIHILLGINPIELAVMS